MARDGSLVPDVSSIQRMATILFARRNESLALYEQAVDVTDTLRWIDAWNAEGRPRLTLFLLLLHAAGRLLHEHPRLNRFISGRRLYQRDGVWLAFDVKKEMTEAAPLAVIKREARRGEALEDFLTDIHERVRDTRSERTSYDDKKLKLLLSLPHVVLIGLVRMLRLADFMNLLPASFIRNDPFFASIFLTNLGSVGGDAIYHHLFEYGTTSMFACLGLVREEVVARDGAPAVRTIARIKYAYDERIEDGFNALRALTQLKEWIERPELLAGGAGAVRPPPPP